MLTALHKQLMHMWSAECCLCNQRGSSSYQLFCHKRQHQEPLHALGVLPCRLGFLSHVSSIMEWFSRLTSWPFDGTHRLISPPSARQVAGQAGCWRRWSGDINAAGSAQFSACARPLSHPKPLVYYLTCLLLFLSLPEIALLILILLLGCYSFSTFFCCRRKSLSSWIRGLDKTGKCVFIF